MPTRHVNPPARRRLFLLAAALVAIAAASFHYLASPERPLAGPPEPTPVTVMRVDPPAQNVTLGSNVTVQIFVDNVTNMAAYEFELHFFATTLGYVSVENGPLLGSGGANPFCLTQTDLGKVRFGCVTQGDQNAVSGSGLLATVTFTTSCGGPSPLVLKIAGLSDPLGTGIPTRSQNGNVTVQGGAPCPTPSPTPRPTATPTATRTPVPTAAGLVGDANCDHSVNSIDAAVVLQFVAGIIHSLQCTTLANVNHDASVDSIDAAVILQFVAGIISHF